MDLFAPRHLLVILVVVVLVFGTKKLRNIGSDLGSAVRGFKKAMSEGEAAPVTEPERDKLLSAAPPAPSVADATGVQPIPPRRD